MVRGPVMTGDAAASSRTAARRVTGRRSSPHVISRGLPSNQPVRTWTSTGSTRIIAIPGSLRVADGGPPTRDRSVAFIDGAHRRLERLFGSDEIVHRTPVRCQV